MKNPRSVLECDSSPHPAQGAGGEGYAASKTGKAGPLGLIPGGSQESFPKLLHHHHARGSPGLRALGKSLEMPQTQEQASLLPGPHGPGSRKEAERKPGVSLRTRDLSGAGPLTGG